MPAHTCTYSHVTQTHTSHNEKCSLSVLPLVDRKGTRTRASSATPLTTTPDEVCPVEASATNSQRGIYGFLHGGSVQNSTSSTPTRESDTPSVARARSATASPQEGMFCRFRCATRDKRFTSTTGSLFNNLKLPVAVWADALLQAPSFQG